ncbi:MAG: hypothetical protein RI894_2374 [Bacteroidota bacterium]
MLARIAYILSVQLLVILLITSLVYLAPIDPARLTFGQRADAGTLAAKRAELGLDASLPQQMLWYLNDISPISIHGDSILTKNKFSYFCLFALSQKSIVIKKPYLRQSYQNGRNVTELLSDAIPKTALLALLAMLGATLTGLFFGVIAALHHNSWIDRIVNTIAVLGVSLPSYVVAILLAFVFGYLFRDFTHLNLRGGLYTLDLQGNTTAVWRNLLLPAIALGIRPVALIASLTRSTMLDVLGMDYVRTARAKGLSEPVVIIRHALRNALNPVTTAVSGWFASLLTGAFFVETVFNYDGLGSLTVNALINYDMPVVLGTVLFSAGLFVFINILTDTLYYWLDPRMR